jgi:hypothetical protein
MTTKRKIGLAVAGLAVIVGGAVAILAGIGVIGLSHDGRAIESAENAVRAVLRDPQSATFQSVSVRRQPYTEAVCGYVTVRGVGLQRFIVARDQIGTQEVPSIKIEDIPYLLAQEGLGRLFVVGRRPEWAGRVRDPYRWSA